MSTLSLFGLLALATILLFGLFLLISRLTEKTDKQKWIGVGRVLLWVIGAALLLVGVATWLALFALYLI